MSKKNDQKLKLTPEGLYQQEEHGKPVSRRDFISRSVAGLSTYAMMPSLLTLLSTEALAQSACSTAGGGQMPAFLVFDCAGGASLAGNWIPTDNIGGLLRSYSSMGLGNSTAAIVADRQFGAPLADTTSLGAGTSKIRQGILAATNAAARSALKMGIFNTPSLSDTGANMLNPIMLIANAGVRGSIVQSGLSLDSGNFGASSQGPAFNAAFKPLRIGSFNDVAGAVTVGGALNNLPPGAKTSLLRTLANLSAAQAQRFMGLNLASQLETASRCGWVQNQASIAAGSAGLDPRQDAIFQAIYGIAAGTNAGDANVRIATVVMNALKGQSGPGVIQINGCDYHGTGLANTDAKDLEIGTTIGRAVQAAVNMNRALCFMVITDGGIASDDGTRNWNGDSNGRSLAVFGFVNPTGAPNGNSSIRAVRTQIGAYVQGQSADNNTLIGSSPQMAAYAALANYLSITGKLGQFGAIAGNAVQANQLDSLLLFG